MALNMAVTTGQFNNIGLMDERRNYLTISGVGIVVGVLLFGFGTLAKNQTSPSHEPESFMDQIRRVLPTATLMANDIDRIVLHRCATEVDLNEPSPVPVHDQRTRLASDRKVPLFLAFLLSLPGCQNPEQEAWQKAYEASYNSAYQAGRQAGYARGKQVGDEKGAAAAKVAARTGGAWQLYTNLALGALVLGTGCGLFAQYVILLACRLSERLPQFSTVAFVPAMKSSLAYSVFEQRRRVMVEVTEELTKLRVTHNLQLVQIETTRDYVARKVMAASSIDELSQARFIDLAKMEFSRIVSASNERASRSILPSAERHIWDSSERSFASGCPC